MGKIEVRLKSPVVTRPSVKFRDDINSVELLHELQPITGIDPEDMKVTIRYTNNSSNNEDSHLIIDGKRSNVFEQTPVFKNDEDVSISIEVEDTNPNSMVNLLTQPDLKPSYEMSDEIYDRRPNSVRQWKREHKLGRFDPERMASSSRVVEKDRLKSEQLKLNQRCSVKVLGKPERRGWLRFIGEVPGAGVKGSVWCGIEYDDSVGTNNGTYMDKTFFGPVRDNHGSFVRPEFVETGAQFVPLSKDSDSDSDEI